MPVARSTPILLVSSSEGHLSLANAIKAGLRDRGFTSISLFVENSAVLPYRLYYRYAPWLHSLVSLILGSKFFLGLLRLLLTINYANLTKKIIKKHQPKIVIATNYAFNTTFEPLHRKRILKYFSVICDPRSYNLINVAQAGCFNLVFDDKQKTIIDHDFPHTQNLVTGWFVRPEFQPPTTVAGAKKAVGIDPNKFCALFVAGSEGMQRIQKTVRALAETETAMTILVACGRNKLLYQTIERLGQQLAHSPLSLEPLGFTLDIAPYFQAADVVVGKAGPNMIFEAIACHKPFIATTSLAGQEAGNLDLIKKLGIGFVETDTEKAAKLIVDLINSPEKITRLQPSIKKLAEYNRGAVDRLVEIIDANPPQVTPSVR